MSAKTAKTLVMKGEPGKPGQVNWAVELVNRELPPVGPSDNLVNFTACALNHRDKWLLHNLYPGAQVDVPLGSDGCGYVVEGPLKGKRVVVNAAKGWQSDPLGPEDGGKEFAILGGTKDWKNGTYTDYAVYSSKYLEEAPTHLSDLEAAALPLGGGTAYRAVFTRGQFAKGQNILITGIGGGVALFALQFAKAAGAKHIWVTSSSAEKIAKAEKLGAHGGSNYKNADWVDHALKSLPSDRPYFDLIIDSAGGDIVKDAVKLLKFGGKIVQYGQTLGGDGTPFPMTAVIKQLEFLGSTMYSAAEFRDMLKFVADHKIVPVVSRVVNGLDNFTELYDDMANGRQFGKLVVDIAGKSHL